MAKAPEQKPLWEAIKAKIVDHVAAAIVIAFTSGAALLGSAMYVWLKPQKLVPGAPIKTIVLNNASAESTGSSTGVRLSEGVCHLTKVSGRFDGIAEAIAVYPSADGDWVYDFKHGAAAIAGRIDCFAHPYLE